MSEPDVISVALQCAEAFETARVGYFLGGSLASSLQGEPRATNDIDFVVDLRLPQLEPLERALGTDFDLDVESLREAILRRGSWNIFHLPTVTKVDLFLLGTGAFDASEFSRRRRVVLTADGRGLFIKSPEDSVLRKLLWFQQGGESSSTQWATSSRFSDWRRVPWTCPTSTPGRGRWGWRGCSAGRSTTQHDRKRQVR